MIIIGAIILLDLLIFFLTIFFLLGLIFLYNLYYHSYKEIYYYFEFYISLVPAKVLHIVTIPLSYWFVSSQHNPKFNFLYSVVITLWLLYSLAIIFLHCKGFILANEYKSIKPTNSDQKKELSDKKLWFKYDKNWDKYINEIKIFNKNHSSKFFLDSPQGSGKTTFIKNLKLEIEREKENESNYITIDINTAEFDQEKKPLFLIIKKILKAKAISKKDYIKLEFLTWKGSLSFLSNTWNNEPNDNVMKILEVFYNPQFQWIGKIFVFVDELDRCEIKYLLDFLSFSDDIFGNDKKGYLNKIKVIYLIDQKMLHQKLLKFRDSKNPSDLINFKYFFEKYWESKFKLVFYFQNTFERINKFYNLKEDKIKEINIKGKDFLEFIESNFSYMHFKAKIININRPAINLRKYIRIIKDIIDDIDKNKNNEEFSVLWMIWKHIFKDSEKLLWVSHHEFPLSAKSMIMGTIENGKNEEIINICEKYATTFYYIFYSCAFILDFDKKILNIKPKKTLEENLNFIVGDMKKRTSHLFSQDPNSQLNIYKYTNWLIINTTNVINSIRDKNNNKYKDPNHLFILNHLHFLKTLNFANLNPEKNNFFDGDNQHYLNLRDFLEIIGIKIEINSSLTINIDKSNQLKDQKLSIWFKNIEKQINKEFMKNLALNHLNIFKKIVDGINDEEIKNDYKNIFDYTKSSHRLYTNILTFLNTTTENNLPVSYEQFKENLKRKNEKLYEKSIKKISENICKTSIKKNIDYDDNTNFKEKFLLKLYKEEEEFKNTSVDINNYEQIESLIKGKYNYLEKEEILKNLEKMIRKNCDIDLNYFGNIICELENEIDFNISYMFTNKDFIESRKEFSNWFKILISKIESLEKEEMISLVNKIIFKNIEKLKKNSSWDQIYIHYFEKLNFKNKNSNLKKLKGRIRKALLKECEFDETQQKYFKNLWRRNLVTKFWETQGKITNYSKEEIHKVLIKLISKIKSEEKKKLKKLQDKEVAQKLKLLISEDFTNEKYSGDYWLLIFLKNGEIIRKYEKWKELINDYPIPGWERNQKINEDFDNILNYAKKFISKQIKCNHHIEYLSLKFEINWDDIRQNLQDTLGILNDKTIEKAFLIINNKIKQSIIDFKEEFKSSYCELYFKLKEIKDEDSNN